MIRIEEDIPMEKILEVRREAKRKVFVRNAVRALAHVAPDHDLKKVPNVVLVGGSAEDFERSGDAHGRTGGIPYRMRQRKHPRNRGAQKCGCHRPCNVIPDRELSQEDRQWL